MLFDFHHLSSTERLFAMVGCVVAFLVLLYLFFRQLTRYRLIADTPTARIRSAPQGYVELNGQVAATEGGMLSSPLSGRPCVWYRICVDEFVRTNKGGRWRQVRKERSDNWFQIEDGTGVCLISPEGASVSTAYNRSWYGSTATPLTRGGRQSFAAYAARLLNAGGNRYRYREELIFEYERLYALGDFKSVGGGRDRLDLKQVQRDLLRSWKQDPQQLLARFDANGDGKIDIDEWAKARQAAKRVAQKQQAKLDQVPTMNVLCDPEQSGQPFLLSTHDEQTLIQRYRWILLAILACVLLSIWVEVELLLSTPA